MNQPNKSRLLEQIAAIPVMDVSGESKVEGIWRFENPSSSWIFSSHIHH
jgi:hypothetical protein